MSAYSAILSFPLTFDDRVFASLQANGLDNYTVACELFCNIGHGRCIGIILGALILFFILKRNWYSLLTVLLLVPGMLLSELVKVIAQRPRPDPFYETGFSFPCAHVLTAGLAYGMILVILYPHFKTRTHQRLATSITALLVILVGFGRIATGAHYFTDVLAGILFAILWLALCLKCTELLKRRAEIPRAAAIPRAGVLPRIALIPPSPAIQTSPAPRAPFSL